MSASPRTAVGPLRRLAGQRRWRRWAVASSLARLPATMTLLALIVAGQQASGSLATGAQLAGLATLVTGFAAPWRARRLDRAGLRPGLQRACMLTAGVLLAEVAVLALGLGVGALAVLAMMQGLAYAPVLGGFRALLPAVVDDVDLPRANALEAVFVEVTFVSGPALAGSLALVSGPAVVLVVMAATLVAAAVLTRRLPSPEALTAPGSLSLVRVNVRVRVVFALGAAMGACLGAFEATVPARAAELGLSSAAGGPLLALTALGSGIAGLVLSGQDPTRRLRRLATGLLAAFAVLIAATAAGGSPVALGVALLIAGAPIAPLNALGMLVLQRDVPAGRQAEGFSLFIAAILIGAGLGQAAAGEVFADYGARAALLAASALPLIAATCLAVAPGRRQHPDASHAPGSTATP